MKVFFMTYGAQILIKPLKIKSIPKKRELVGVVDVVLRKNLKPQKALIYKSCDNVFDTDGELYRLVINKKKVIGYTLITIHNKEMHLPLLGSLDLHYKTGKILSGIAIERFLKSDCDALHLTSSWNSLLHHKNTGFQILPQKNVEGKKIDKIIASGKIRNIEKIGCITMYLPQKTIAKFLSNEPILKTNKLFKLNGEVGRVKDYIIYKKTHKIKFEEYIIMRNNQIIGNIYLNYYKNEKGVYKNYFGEIPQWSPLYLYGDEKGVNKVFAEFWSVDAKSAEEEEEILGMLIQIALESGKYKNCAKLQLEADWDEHTFVYKQGFRTKNIEYQKTCDEIIEIIKGEEKNPKTSNLNKIGSIDMVLTKEDAIKYGWNAINILK